jgi:hypothetical protein
MRTDMLCFPQLTSGSVSQYTLSRSLTARTITNVLEDGSTIRTADGPNKVRWGLRYSELSSEELESICQLFDAVKGRLGTFTFLDPLGNLLAWSEDYRNPVWHSDPLLQIVDGVPDAIGGSRATRLTNTAQTTQRMLQYIEGPSSYRYCFSVYLGSQQAGTVRLVQSATGYEIAQATVVAPGWIRASLSTTLPVATDGISFGIELAPGGQVDIYGAQVEAQPGAGKYKKTVERAGVYSQSRFDQDMLTATTTGPNQHSSDIRIVSNLITG